jgi:peptidoglycan/xylan/chitin deacetylase (PgdA/CDA1 family)
MRLHTLMYHDVVADGQFDASGFPGPGPARYKIDWELFVEHLDRIGGRVSAAPLRGDEILTGRTPEGWAITSDDGGESSLRMGEELARRGWSAHFFITTGRIDHPGFVSSEAVQRLDAMGHVIGSHSRTHPRRLSACSPDELLEEWRSSVEHLADLLHRPVVTASVPGGYHSIGVTRAAAAAGIRMLFTSEPIDRARPTGDCLVAGRFAVHSGTPAKTVAAAASGVGVVWRRQRAGWNARKAIKVVGGEAYIKARSALLARSWSGRSHDGEHGR